MQSHRSTWWEDLWARSTSNIVIMKLKGFWKAKDLCSERVEPENHEFHMVNIIVILNKSQMSQALAGSLCELHFPHLLARLPTSKSISMSLSRYHEPHLAGWCTSVYPVGHFASPAFCFSCLGSTVGASSTASFAD